EMELNVVITDARTAADETAGLEVIARAETVLRHNPAHPDQRLPPWPHVRVKGDRLLARHLEVKLEVILQVLTYAREVMHHGDSVPRELGGRSNAGKFQQLWRVDRSATDDHLAACAYDLLRVATTIANSESAPLLEQNPGCEG